ncbi:MAG: protein translocase subunit SecF [Chloroflexi bacterium]|nr:protein translocase subunit SecF [Chloroflexota bacterium]
MRPSGERKTILDFVGKRYWYFAFSFIVIAVAVVSLLIPPRLKVGIDFESGAIMEAQFEKQVSQTDLRAKLAELGYPEAIVQTSGGNRFVVQTRALVEGQIDPSAQTNLESAVAALAPDNGTAEKASGDTLAIRFKQNLTARAFQDRLHTLINDDFAMSPAGTLQQTLTLKKAVPEASIREQLHAVLGDDYTLEQSGQDVYLITAKGTVPETLRQKLAEVDPEQFALEPQEGNTFKVSFDRPVQETLVKSAISGIAGGKGQVQAVDNRTYTLSFPETVDQEALRTAISTPLQNDFLLRQGSEPSSFEVRYKRPVSEAALSEKLAELPPGVVTVEPRSQANSYRIQTQFALPEADLKQALTPLAEGEVAFTQVNETAADVTFPAPADIQKVRDAVEQLMQKSAFTVQRTGVAVYDVTFKRDLTLEQLRPLVSALPVPNLILKPGALNTYEVIFPGEKANLLNGLEAAFGNIPTLEFNSVSPLVAARTTRIAAIAVVVATIGIVLYITWAFRRMPRPFRWGMAALVALGHDVIITLGAFSLLGKAIGAEVNLMFITGILTVVGFSVHDTIVVFDRLRENMARGVSTSFDTVVNVSIVETAARSISTSLTLVFTVVAILLFGGATLRDFMLVLLVGVITGTYSSIFIAAQLLVAWEKGELAKPARFATAPVRWIRGRRGGKGAPAKAS